MFKWSWLHCLLLARLRYYFFIMLILLPGSGGMRSSRIIGLTTRSSFVASQQVLFSPRQLQLVPKKENMDGGGQEKPTPPNVGVELSEKREIVRKRRLTAFPSFAYEMSGRNNKRKKKHNQADLSRRDPIDAAAASSPNPSAADVFISLEDRSKTISRLLSNRSYAKRAAFASDSMDRPPSLDDICTPIQKRNDRFWISTPFRIILPVAAYFFFPSMTETLSRFVSDSPDDLSRITSTFIPGVSIVYGTFVSLTLSILNTRQSRVQEHASLESSMLSILARDLLRLFANDRRGAIDACQCVADQVGRLVTGSRGRELMGLMYSDPYARVLELVTEKSFDLATMEKEEFGPNSALLGSINDICKDLTTVRSQRLSFEALALPPTHFFVLISLTTWILVGFILATISSSGGHGAVPSNESAILFSILCSVYVLFYNLAYDLNSPFEGVYQIRRSSISSHLLQIKLLLCNHPLTYGEVDFDEFLGEIGVEVTCATPGLGDKVWSIKDYSSSS